MRPQHFDKHTLPRIFMQQGMDDLIVSVESAREAAKWLSSAGFNAELREYPHTEHVLSDEMVKDVRQLLVTHLAHRTRLRKFHNYSEMAFRWR
jgi:predicted esterase